MDGLPYTLQGTLCWQSTSCVSSMEHLASLTQPEAHGRPTGGSYNALKWAGLSFVANDSSRFLAYARTYWAYDKGNISRAKSERGPRLPQAPMEGGT